MSRYFNVRGFLDCDYGDLDVIRDVVAQYRDKAAEFQLAEDVVALYMDGWLYQEREINWIAHAFFGASMRRGGVHLVLDQVERLAKLIPELEGVFFVDDGEGGPRRRWDVTGGRVTVR